MSTKDRGIIVLAILAMMAAFYFTPHLAAYRMRAAAQANDSVTLASVIDFPSLRESVKAGITAKIQTEMANHNTQQATAWANIGAGPLSDMVNPMVDALVTPQAIGSFMKGETPGKDQSGSSEEPGYETNYAYEDVNQFVVHVRRKTAKDGAIGLVFLRSGLVSWKLSRLRLSL